MRRERYLLDAVAGIVEENVADLVVFAVNGIAIQCLDFDVLRICVLLAGGLELLFLRGKFLDDLVDRDAGRLRRIERPLATVIGDGRNDQT